MEGERGRLKREMRERKKNGVKLNINKERMREWKGEINKERKCGN